jgi:hypothetical protein
MSYGIAPPLFIGGLKPTYEFASLTARIQQYRHRFQILFFDNPIKSEPARKYPGGLVNKQAFDKSEVF